MQEEETLTPETEVVETSSSPQDHDSFSKLLSKKDSGLLTRQTVLLLIGLSMLFGTVASLTTLWFAFPILLSTGAIRFPALHIGSRAGGSVVFGITNAQLPYINLTDTNGVPRISMQIDDKGPFCQIDDVNGKTKLLLGTSGKNYGVFLYGKDENPRAILTVAENKDAASLFLYGNNNKLSLALSTSDDENCLTVLDKNEKERAVLGSTELKNEETGTTTHASESTLTLFNTKGKVITKLPLWE